MRLFKYKKSFSNNNSTKKCGALYHINKHTYSAVQYSRGTWEPLVAGPEFAMDTVNGRSCLHVRYGP